MFELPIETRFWAKVDRRGPDECWPWRGKPGARGYGTFSFDNLRRRATHISLELSGKPRPSPRHGACHTCDNPPCVNPAHLWWGDQSENLRDALAKKRLPHALKTHCRLGHPLSGDNLLLHKEGWRQCRKCTRAQTREAMKRLRARKALSAKADKREGRDNDIS